jgi:hypothetical protein
MEIDGNMVWAVYDPCELEEVLFANREEALKFVQILSTDLETGDQITISFKAVRQAVASDTATDEDGKIPF